MNSHDRQPLIENSCQALYIYITYTFASLHQHSKVQWTPFSNKSHDGHDMQARCIQSSCTINPRSGSRQQCHALTNRIGLLSSYSRVNVGSSAWFTPMHSNACMHVTRKFICKYLYLYIYSIPFACRKKVTKLLIANAMKYFAICMGPMFANQYLRWSEFWNKKPKLTFVNRDHRMQ